MIIKTEYSGGGDDGNNITTVMGMTVVITVVR